MAQRGAQKTKAVCAPTQNPSQRSVATEGDRVYIDAAPCLSLGRSCANECFSLWTTVRGCCSEGVSTSAVERIECRQRLFDCFYEQGSPVPIPIPIPIPQPETVEQVVDGWKNHFIIASAMFDFKRHQRREGYGSHGVGVPAVTVPFPNSSTKQRERGVAWRSIVDICFKSIMKLD